MTERLYYNDPYQREFDATITRVDSRHGRWHVWLDRSAFYPTSGGQPFDTGTLGSNRVDEVVEDEAGDLVHMLVPAPVAASSQPSGARSELAPAEPAAIEPPPVGTTVHGSIDWQRRFDHMQQHTGQHVLSAAIDRLCGVRTVSFHLGAATATIDVARALTIEEITAAEEEANRIVWEDRPVAIRYASAEEAAQLALRKESLREGTLRLIDVQGFDLSACGGTHVSRTGAVGVIGIAAWERVKAGQRLEFVCGRRALHRFRGLRDATTASLRLLSVLPDDLPAAIERLQADARDHKKAIATLQTELAAFRAEALANEGEAHARGRLLLKALDADAGALKTIASALASRPGLVAVLVSTSTPALIVAARGAEVPVSAHEIVTALTKRFGGRGGGKGDLAQAGGLVASAEDILGAARDLIAPQLG
jgi:alanyl-tRNA synthetase